MKPLKLGIIGLSEGNGHPYSWSAIFNGYDPVQMAGCGFPVIPEYLSERRFPQDFLTHDGIVTHVWSQESALSRKIALACRIEHVVNRPQDMIGYVDAVLLARDDAENHPAMAEPFLKAGLSVFIDKPFALSVADAHTMLGCQTREAQIFTCSSLRYAPELMLSEMDRQNLGTIRYTVGTVMKKWETYGIHILEPIVAMLPHRGRLLKVTPVRNHWHHSVLVEWENCVAALNITGAIPAPLQLTFHGESGHTTLTFNDSFTCFRNSLAAFIEQKKTGKPAIAVEETLELTGIIERGIC